MLPSQRSYKMDNMELVIDKDGVEQVIIHREDGSQLSMSKARWDELETQREQSGTL